MTEARWQIALPKAPPIPVGVWHPLLRTTSLLRLNSTTATALVGVTAAVAASGSSRDVRGGKVLEWIARDLQQCRIELEYLVIDADDWRVLAAASEGGDWEAQAAVALLHTDEILGHRLDRLLRWARIRLVGDDSRNPVRALAGLWLPPGLVSQLGVLGCHVTASAAEEVEGWSAEGHMRSLVAGLICDLDLIATVAWTAAAKGGEASDLLSEAAGTLAEESRRLRPLLADATGGVRWSQQADLVATVCGRCFE